MGNAIRLIAAWPSVEAIEAKQVKVVSSTRGSSRSGSDRTLAVSMIINFPIAVDKSQGTGSTPTPLLLLLLLLLLLPLLVWSLMLALVLMSCVPCGRS